MLTFFTSSDQGMVEKTFGRSLKSFRPNIPAHQFKLWTEGCPPPEPEAGSIVLVCGVKPYGSLQAAGYAPKNRTVTSMRETPIPRNGGWYIVTFDPAIISSEAEYAKTGVPVKVSMDTETMGLYPWYDGKDFVSISFTHRPGRSEMLYFGPQSGAVALDNNSPMSLEEQIRWLLTSPKVRLRGANLKYDLIWVKEKWGIDCTNFKFDTMLVGTLVDENRSNSLNLHAKLMTDFGGYDSEFNKTYDKGKMDQVPVEPLRVYQGGDTDACYRVADILQAELEQDPDLKKFYVTILHPAARAFEK